MFYQSTKGIYVYRIGDKLSKDITYHYYSRLEEFFYQNMYIRDLYWNGVSYISNPDFSWDYGVDLYVKSKRTKYCEEEGICQWGSNYNYVVYDDEGKLYPPAYLTSVYQEFHNRLIKRRAKITASRSHNRRHGRKRQAFGTYRHIKTTQERRMSYAFDEDNFVKGRGRRNAKNLPNSWDDFYGHAEKSWKFQSKRKHQWK